MGLMLKPSGDRPDAAPSPPCSCKSLSFVRDAVHQLAKQYIKASIWGPNEKCVRFCKLYAKKGKKRSLGVIRRDPFREAEVIQREFLQERRRRHVVLMRASAITFTLQTATTLQGLSGTR